MQQINATHKAVEANVEYSIRHIAEKQVINGVLINSTINSILYT